MNTEERLERIESLIRISAKNVLNTKEVAILMDLSESRVRHLVSENIIPYYKMGSKTYFNKSEIESWLLSNRYDSRSEIESKAATYITTKDIKKCTRTE